MIKKQRTFYFCQFIQLPEVSVDMHFTHFDILVDKANKEFVHHVVVYDCNLDASMASDIVYDGAGYECGYANYPMEVARCMSTSTIAFWVRF